MVLAQPPGDYSLLQKSLRPAITSAILGDVATGFCYGMAVLSCIFGAPEKVKTIALVAAAGSATVQYFANSNEEAVNQAIAVDALRETQLKGLNHQLMDRQGLERSQAEIHNQIVLLHQIAQAPKALQPLLLEQHGFSHIIPLLMDQTTAAAVPSSPPRSARPADAEHPAAEDTGTVIDVTGLDIDPQAESMERLQQFSRTPKNLFLVAKPGGGKGMFLANYLRWRRQAEAHLLVFYIDPKGDPKERGYWDEPWIQHHSFQAATMEPDELALALDEAFQAFQRFVHQNPGVPYLLVMDEALATSTMLGACADKSQQQTLKTLITRSVTLLDSINAHCIVVSQSPNAGDAGVSAGVLKTMTAVCVFRRGEYDTITHAAKHGGVTLDQRPTNAALERLCEQSPCGRGFYLQGKLHPMPKLTNYSGYDRDSRSWVATAHDPNAAEDFADESGLSGDLETDDRVDDAGDLINLRLRYQQAREKPSGEELVQWWNEVATVPLEADNKTMTGLLQIVEMSEPAFEAFLAENLSDD